MGGQCEKSALGRSEINREIPYEFTCDATPGPRSRTNASRSVNGHRSPTDSCAPSTTRRPMSSSTSSPGAPPSCHDRVPAHPIPHHLRPELQTPRPHPPPYRPHRSQRPTPSPFAHRPTEPDAAPQAGVPIRPRTPSPVRRPGAHPRQHRCPRGHPHDSLPSRRAGPPQTPRSGTTQRARAASGTVGPGGLAASDSLTVSRPH